MIIGLVPHVVRYCTIADCNQLTTDDKRAENRSRFSPQKPDEKLVMTFYHPYNRSKNGNVY